MKNSHQKSVSILGCGWLGTALGESLVKKGVEVKGSVTHSDHFALLQEKNIEPSLITLFPKTNVIDQLFFNCDICVIALPFKRDYSDPKVYLDQIKSILPLLIEGGVSSVIFTSSTSVYPNENQLCMESDELKSVSLRATVLLDVEELLMKETSFKTTIVRLAGLFGPDREVGKRFDKDAVISVKNCRVNLIHQKDAVRLIETIIEKEVGDTIYNAVSPNHPKRGDLYETVWRDRIEFEILPCDADKIVDHNKAKKELGFVAEV